MKGWRNALVSGAAVTLMLLCTAVLVSAGIFTPVGVVDQTPLSPVADPAPASYQPRYVSGFGLDDSFTIFFEDRDNANVISYVSTTTGPTGFPAGATATNIADTHFVVKDWPIHVGGADYAYRGWGAVGNNQDHHFYVSNDLANWTLVSTFTIPNAAGFTDAVGHVFYGFHDVILLNGTYYAFAESNCSETMIVRSTEGTDVWEAFVNVGGTAGDGPLELPTGASTGWTPSGSFVDLGHDRGYGKVYVDPRDSDFYLAVNTAAVASLPPADLEAAFINPANWTWHDDTTGPAATPFCRARQSTICENAGWSPTRTRMIPGTIVYDADFGVADGGKALVGRNCIRHCPPQSTWMTTMMHPVVRWPATPGRWDCFDVIQDGVNAVAASGAVYVADGTYLESNLRLPRR